MLKRSKLVLTSILFTFLLFPTRALADNIPLCDIAGQPNIGVNTAIGCLAAGDPTLLIGQLLGWGTVVGGGIAFLMIIFAGFQMVTASGDPKRVKAAQELMTSAISGLLLIIFSIFLLNLIGIKILGLGTLGGFQP